MQLLSEIYEKDADIAKNRDHFRRRSSVRAVVQDNTGRVALLLVGKHNYHKLPGGGIEVGEDLPTALRREALEELGCEVVIRSELGIITEYRDNWGLIQDSHCFVAFVAGNIGTPAYTQEEIADEFSVVWTADFAEAIAILEADKPANYEGPLILRRDLTLLRAARDATR